MSNAGSNNVQLSTSISDGDLLIKGNDGGSIITALTLDMSDAGQAFFNKGIQSNAPQGNVAFYGANAGSYIQVAGSSSTFWALGSTGDSSAPNTAASTVFGFHHWNGSAWSQPVALDTDGVKLPSGKGIKFADHGSGNILHDYEEGTFTPTLSGGSTAGSFTAGSGTSGRYVKIGKICKADVGIRNSTVTGASGTFKINGLPFNAFDNAVFSISSTLMMHNVTFNSDRIQAFYMVDNVLFGIESISGSAWQDWAITNSAGIYLQLTIVFEVDE